MCHVFDKWKDGVLLSLETWSKDLLKIHVIRMTLRLHATNEHLLDLSVRTTPEFLLLAEMKDFDGQIIVHK